MSRYVPISEVEMTAKLTAMGFKQVLLQGTHEMVFDRQVAMRDGKLIPAAVRIYTSVVPAAEATGASRGCGEDAIRVVLVDTRTGRPLAKKEKRVHRTKSALTNMTQRARDLWVQARDNACPACSHQMVERNGSRGKFLGCSNYPVCNKTLPIAAVAA